MSFSIQAMSAYVQRVFTRIPLLRAVRLWLDADGLRMSAAMSFYGMLSLAPLLLLIVGLLGWWIDKDYLESNLIGQVQGVMGERGAEVVRMALAEDLGRTGDVTAQACIPEGARFSAVFSARQAGVMAGGAVVRIAVRDWHEVRYGRAG